MCLRARVSLLCYHARPKGTFKINLMANKRARIVVIGGGFGGLFTALE
jgi:hypothetical protein